MKEEFLRNWDTQLKKGVLPLYVLQILQEKECYGYELIQELKLSKQMEVTDGTIYPLLIRLMKENLLTHKWVEQTSGIPRKYYKLTQEGIESLKEMKVMISNIILKIN